IPLQQVMCRHHLAGDTEPALHGALGEERVLQRAELSVLAQSFDRGDLAALDLGRKHQAGVDGAAVHQQGARAALAEIAALLGPGEVEIIADEVQQGGAFGHVNLALGSVDVHVESHGHAARSFSMHERSARRLMTRSIAARYSRLPRTSEIGLACAMSPRRASSFARSEADGSARTPVSSATRNGRGPTAPYANRVRPPASTMQHRRRGARLTRRRRVMRANWA